MTHKKTIGKIKNISTPLQIMIAWLKMNSHIKFIDYENSVFKKFEMAK